MIKLEIMLENLLTNLLEENVHISLAFILYIIGVDLYPKIQSYLINPYRKVRRCPWLVPLIIISSFNEQLNG